MLFRSVSQSRFVANGIIVHNSRRYVSGERVPFEFYVSNKMKEVLLFDEGVSVKGSKVKTCFTAQDIIDISLKFYKQALSQGVKPQEARRIIPQAAYTQIWGAFMPKQLDNYFKLRHETPTTFYGQNKLLKDTLKSSTASPTLKSR